MKLKCEMCGEYLPKGLKIYYHTKKICRRCWKKLKESRKIKKYEWFVKYRGVI